MTEYFDPIEDLRQMRIDAWRSRREKKTEPHKRSDYMKELHLVRDLLQNEYPWRYISSQNIEAGTHLLSAHYTHYLREYICETGYFGCTIRDEAFKKVLPVQLKKSRNIGEIILCQELIALDKIGPEKLSKRAQKAYDHVRIAAEMMANKKDVELGLLAEEPGKPIVHQLLDMKGDVVGESFSAGRPDELIYLPGATRHTDVLHEKLERYYGRLTA